jgi:hypothetical protein
MSNNITILFQRKQGMVESDVKWVMNEQQWVSGANK